MGDTRSGSGAARNGDLHSARLGYRPITGADAARIAQLSATNQLLLVGLPAAMHADSQIRQYLAILWNNLGIEQEKREGTKVSIKAFQKAASFDAKNPTIQLNLAHAY